MKTSVVRSVSLGIVASVALAVGACSDGGGGAAGNGGFITIDSIDIGGGGAFNTAQAEFVTSSGTVVNGVPGCTIVPPPTPIPSATAPVPHALDAGTSVRLKGAVSSIVMANNGSNYYLSNPSKVLYGSSYDIVLSGGADLPAKTWPKAFPMPKMPAFTDLSIPASHVLSWTPGSGEDAVLTFVDTSSGPVAICNVSDSGSFTIPQDVFDALPPSGVVGIGSIMRRTLAVNGRAVSLVGNATLSHNYSK